jgi:RNA ligase (TIGR02306 family)
MRKIEIVEGLDVTELLSIQKYDPEIHSPGGSFNTGIAKGNFPSYIPKTDETRIQSMPRLLEKYKGTMVIGAEKLDGSSITVLKKDGEIHVCSRKLDLKEDNEHCRFWATVKRLGIDNRLKASGYDNIGIQGELIGPGIQQNKYKLKEHDIFFFNVYDISSGKYYDADDAMKIMWNLDIKPVPVIYLGLLQHTVDELVELSRGRSELHDVHREGLVFRPMWEIYDDRHGRLSFKVINPDFLLKYDA